MLNHQVSNSDRSFEAILLPLGSDAANKNIHQQFTCHLLKITPKSIQNTKDKKNISQILLDLGSERCCNSNFVNFQALDFIFLSHSHLDHTGYIGKLVKILNKSGRIRPLALICHPKTWKMVKKLIKIHNKTIPSFINYIPIYLTIDKPYLKSARKRSKTDYSQILELDPMELGANFILKVQSAPAKHSRSSIVFRIKIYKKEKESLSSDYLDLVFSPDTAYKSEHLIPFVKGTNYWLLDTTFTREFIEDHVKKINRKKYYGEIVGHSSSYHSAVLCQKAKVRNYVIVHFFWERFAEKFEDVEQLLIKRAKKGFDGNVIVAIELRPISLELCKSLIFSRIK